MLWYGKWFSINWSKTFWQSHAFYYVDLIWSHGCAYALLPYDFTIKISSAHCSVCVCVCRYREEGSVHRGRPPHAWGEHPAAEEAPEGGGAQGGAVPAALWERVQLGDGRWEVLSQNTAHFVCHLIKHLNFWVERMDETLLSVFHSVSNHTHWKRSRNRISSAVRYVILVQYSLFFLSRARDSRTFTLNRIRLNEFCILTRWTK